MHDAMSARRASHAPTPLDLHVTRAYLQSSTSRAYTSPIDTYAQATDTTSTMSREQYTPPSLTQTNQSSGGSGNAAGSSSYNTSGGGFNITGSSGFEDTARPVNYLCGDCDAKVVLKKSDPIRCKECGYRVLYKERTNR
jgi:DNA-directed RNA polymerases I, II, and III subunit RPABC4